MKITPKDARALVADPSASPAVRAIAKSVVLVDDLGEQLHKQMLAFVEEGQKTQRELARSKHELHALTRVLADAIEAESKERAEGAAPIELVDNG